MNSRVLLSTCFILVTVNSKLINGLTKQEIDSHLDQGIRLMAAGQLADALNSFHIAIEADPANYMSYYRRATIYLGMGKFKAALTDLNRVIELKPDFVSARLQRANVLVKQGSFGDAINDYETVVKADRTNAEAGSRLDKIYTVINDIDTAKHLMNSGDYASSIHLFSQALEFCPWSTEIHELRSDCYLSIGEVNKAILDINALAKLIPDNTKAYFRLSELHYSIGDADLALNDIRECLRLDPDHKKCSDFYKSLRKLNKLIERMRKSNEEQNWVDCVQSAEQVMGHDKNSYHFIHRGKSYICMCNQKAQHSKEAIKVCSELLENNPNDSEAMYYRAQAYIDEELLDKALQDCQRANDIEQSHRAQECVEKVSRLIKQSKKRDYYKILGVKRSADKNTILKAYRKLAHKWHPDKFDDPAEKEKAQKTFIDIAAAKEVLTDPEKRQRFDHGEDPLDAEEQAHHGFNPFQGGFNPFGGQGGQGGNFHFKFKFN